MVLKIKALVIGFLLIGLSALGQSKLLFDEALEKLLLQNYDIQVQVLSKQIAENTASKLNNNYLPTLSVDAGGGWTYFGGENRLEDRTIELDPNASYTYDAALSLNYIIFNGFGRKYQLKINEENLALAEAEYRLLIQNSILELGRIYYEVAFLEENVALLESSMEISKDRLLRASYGFEYGRNSRVDVLNAKVDFNQDSIAFLNGKLDFENALRNLNLLMGDSIEAAYQLEKQVQIDSTLDLGTVLEVAQDQNLELAINEHNYLNSKYALANSRAPWMPTLSANAGYNYRGSEDPNGAFLKGSERLGPQAGIRLTWNVFNGQNIVNQQNAKLRLQQAEVRQKQIKQQVKAQAYNAFSLYKNAMAVLQAQEDNVATAERNFVRSKEALNLGQITNAEYRSAQLNYLQAMQNRSKAKYDTKNAELQVYAIMGELK
ncbi:TolC family protein [Luteibaculum oceani]|uniref:TolC family protein n=1 Tax=Luteibaculum oceani TaxID=1294296 RepID=A0A5C6UUE1_9FLAO|nr:TolC family protein [Luteibaculum oceani]TXC76937.1 TolC family protein [Luteibaculum oceani]